LPPRSPGESTPPAGCRLDYHRSFAATAFFTPARCCSKCPLAWWPTLGTEDFDLLGSATLFASTLLYLLLWRIEGPFWAWAVVSMLLGLGFSFYSGATEAWLVDGLQSTGYRDTLDSRSPGARSRVEWLC
jgi:hypothetical protein